MKLCFELFDKTGSGKERFVFFGVTTLSGPTP